MFAIGDRVRCLVDVPCGNRNIHIGSTGTVCNKGYGEVVDISWDDFVYGHDCDGNREYGYGWAVGNRDVELFIDEVIEVDDYMTILFPRSHGSDWLSSEGETQKNERRT